MAHFQRRLPIGAEVMPDGSVHFRAWAPQIRQVSILMRENEADGSEVRRLSLHSEKNGYFSGRSEEAKPGWVYQYILDGREPVPDPASRFQPLGPHGPSRIVDPSFSWTDGGWTGLKWEKQVLYEMHLGTFTREGTWMAAADQLAELARIGLTTIEIMPVVEFPGRFGWSYDCASIFAPSHLYGEPDDFRRFVDMAHSLGLGVILDVVYNHMGPEGNYLSHFSPDYFTDRYETEWGEAINFDGENSAGVREFFISNAGYWIEEFHLDGLRIDATQNIYDSSSTHILSCISKAARTAAGSRTIAIIAENEPQNVICLRRPEDGGYGADAVWNDDFHHTVAVALTGLTEAYYSDYLGTPQELISTARWGYLFQGQRYFWQRKPRGTPTFGFAPTRFINYIQNHDQIANSANGSRIHRLTSPGCYRAATAFLMLAPGIPMLFQGQEFGASTPFLFFADLNDEVAPLMRKGRIGFLKQFTNIQSKDVASRIPDPSALSTFELCKLDLSEREKNLETYALHLDLIKLRREDPVFGGSADYKLEGAVLGPQSFLLRYLHQKGDRLILINLGTDLRLNPAPEPLLAPPENSGWKILWSSENPRYGGCGTPKIETEHYWKVPAHAAVVLIPEKRK